MAKMKDKEYSLALVDPPYGVKRDVGFGGFGGFGEPIARRQYKGGWDNERPPEIYFKELLRVADKCIIFGGNYFADLLPQGKHWIVWDKLNTMPTFGDCELIWTNIPRNSVKKYTHEWNGLLGKEKTSRIHPTQKPVALYQWLLKNYAKKRDRILDTHLGSGSSAIAADIMGFDFTGYEIDKDYYEAALGRFNRHKQQQVMSFD
jgi:site-specific DNA-methyltransferase (adenine-specific)